MKGTRVPGREELMEIHRRMAAAAQKLQLLPGRAIWRGTNGSLLGAGVGSSIDFHDFRAYAYGDDPRYIDWKAYARSDQLVMKLYREEIAPKVDLLFDFSASMYVEKDKKLRSFELLYFVAESARVLGSSLTIQLFQGNTVIPLRAEQLFGYALPEPSPLQEEPRIPVPPAEWRYGSLRIVVSDLLFPGEPAQFLSHLSSDRGKGIVLVPFSRSEADPRWEGNLRFVEVEGGESREMHADLTLVENYKRAYVEHFGLWKHETQRFGLEMIRCPAEGSFYECLAHEAIPQGVISI